MNLNSELRGFIESCGFPGSYEVEALPTEASARRYFRLQFTGDHTPSSLVLCVGLPVPYRDQDRFVALTAFLEEQKLPVPHIYGVARETGALLLSDAGERDLLTYLRRAARAGEQDNKRRLVDHAVDILILLQRSTPPDLISDRRFDFDKLNSELEYTFDGLRQTAEELELPYLQLFEVAQFSRELCRYLDRLTPLVIAHRDYHSRNLMVRQEAGKLRYTMIDYQDARLGSPFYDLASLLYDPYSPLDAADRERALGRYLQINGRPERDRQVYLAVALQRVLKALGTYLHQTLKKNFVFAESIVPALDRIEEIAQRGRFPDSIYVLAREIRKRYVPALQEFVSTAIQ